jgi:oligopeptide transport system permease protein
MMNVDKSKLVLVHDTDDLIADQPLETKEVGYYKDSWNRFKRNKASLVAFYIIVIVLFFVAVGPYMKSYDLPETSTIEASRLGNLTPRIPGLEKLGIFDGTREITRGKRLLLAMNSSELGKNAIVDGLPQELIDDPNHPDYADVDTLTVTVNSYEYTNFIRSYLPENYFGILDSNERNDAYEDPLGAVRRTLTQEEFEEYVEKNYIIDILRIQESENPDNPDEPYFQYEVRVNQFLVSLDQLPEDTYFWLGTTNAGKDLFTEIWLGARISLFMALSVITINSVVGLTIGAIAGYYGGALDLMMDRIVEIISSIPFLSVLILLTLRYGSPLWVIILAFTATGWIGMYRTGRMQFYRFKNREYVFAARTLGANDRRIMFKHIFPNTLGLIVTRLALSVPAFVFTEASFSFLGIINYSDATSVGMLIQQGQNVMATHPHLLIYPSIYIAVLMIAFNLFGNGLRDAFNPSLRGVE